MNLRYENVFCEAFFQRPDDSNGAQVLARGCDANYGHKYIAALELVQALAVC